VVAAPKRSKL